MVDIEETREECNMEKYTVAKYLVQLLTDKELEYKIKEKLYQKGLYYED